MTTARWILNILLNLLAPRGTPPIWPQPENGDDDG
jgi:hypothetical protein